MASIIDASTAGVGGIITTADNSGNLNIQSGGSTKIAVTSSGVAVTGLAKASLPTGSVLQVVNATLTTYITTSTATYADTGLTATITPTSATSKILILVNHSGCYKANNTFLTTKLLRGSTLVAYIDDFTSYTNSTALNSTSLGGTFLDSPATTSATTYKTQFASGNGIASAQINNYATNNSTSTITLMEIAA